MNLAVFTISSQTRFQHIFENTIPLRVINDFIIPTAEQENKKIIGFNEAHLFFQ